ncbi:MAG: hypothetical protein IPF99_34675 [Deltaproteobacteria bacterium]|nr:hypothetical protein [Deltaproteobacteria bacterium]
MNDPGPTPTAMRSIASRGTPERASTSSTRGRRRSEWVARRTALDSARTSRPSRTAAEAVKVLVSKARIFTGWTRSGR